MEVVGYMIGFFSVIVAIFTGILAYLAWERKRWVDEIIDKSKDTNLHKKEASHHKGSSPEHSELN